jgi:Fic family protein
MFILDFLCIHPFSDGNGRMSRLMTLLLLYRSGYIVGKYISIEKLIADTKETYYEALQESSENWHEGNNDYLPFVRYILGVILAAYREFSSRVEILITKGLSKPGRVREIIRTTTGKITKSQIMSMCPDISQKTVERALKELLDNQEIIKIGGGRYTSYTWNWEKEQ